MTRQSNKAATKAAVRIGAVTYLNARPLVFSLERIAPNMQVVFDLPSRLADALAAGRLDAAMIPSIEYARGGDKGYSIISDACIACDGPVRSVKLYGRVAPERIGTLALDEGSRTSAALARILLLERFGIAPEVRPLPIGESFDQTDADAAVLIGDRGMLPSNGGFAFEWDLGQEWLQWTGLPFVFAMWIARPGMKLANVDRLLSAARDDGIMRLDEIAHQAAPTVGLPEADCLSYLRDNLTFHLGDRQRQGLERFYALAGRHGFAPPGAKLLFYAGHGEK